MSLVDFSNLLRSHRQKLKWFYLPWRKYIHFVLRKWFVCNAKACAASTVRGNDEGAPVLSVPPGDEHLENLVVDTNAPNFQQCWVFWTWSREEPKRCNILPEQEHLMQNYSCKYSYLGSSALASLLLYRFYFWSPENRFSILQKGRIMGLRRTTR